MMVYNVGILIAFFLLMWFSAGLIFSGISHFSKKLNISAFATSFFFLGILTSIPEFSIGISAILDKQPSIFAGNLIGASFALFALVIPILAILGGGINLAHELSPPKLLFSLLVTLSPLIFVLDGELRRHEGFMMIILYFYLFYFIEKKKGLFERLKNGFALRKKDDVVHIGKIILGGVILFFSSIVIVDKTILLTDYLKISPFIISLLILGIGTNLPELSVAFRSIFEKKKEVAFGDYIGSASSNTLFFGILVMIQGNFVIVGNSFYLAFFFFTLILGGFFIFSRSKHNLSPLEGACLLTIYSIFIAAEVLL